MKALKLGIFGLGTVGSGTMDILTTNGDTIERELGCKIQTNKICVKDLGKKRTIDVDTSMLTTNPDDILKDPDIDIVVEVMGGIDEAKRIVESALNNKKHVVSANKDLVALYGKELTELAKKNNCHFFYEAAVAGGIPILKSLQFALTGNNIKKISGIVNGSTNYILTRMEVEKLSLEEIIEDAKRLGFLEADPSADLEGLDAARKCAILASIGFHSLVTTNQVYVSGITNITLKDIEYALKLGYRIKLLAVAENKEDGIVAKVHPTMLPLDHPLSSVKYELNSVYVEGDMVGETMFYGRGAGALPTGSAVVNDIITIIKRILNGTKPEYAYNLFEQKSVLPIESLDFSYYLRLQFKSGEIEGTRLLKLFEDNNIEIEEINKYSFIENNTNEQIDEFVLVTEPCVEERFNETIEKLSKLESELRLIRTIRIESGL